jgi:peptidyl-prolyl cis-trans isomerase D
MLEALRNASKGWVAAILILVLVGSFGVWGIQDWIGGTPPPKIATVAGEPITPERYQREFADYLRKLERETKTPVSAAEAKAQGLDRIALEEMLNRDALLAKAKTLGLSVTPDHVVDILKKNIPDGQGGINYQALQRILQAGQYTDQEFFELVRTDVLRGQLLRTIAGGTTLPPGLENALHRFRLERRVAEYVLIDPSRAGQIADPDNAALKKYYDTHASAKYSAPEYRAFTAIIAKLDDVKARVTVTDEEVKQAYERARKFYETPEKRKLEQIKFKTEAAARAAAAKLSGGQSFEAVAKAEGYKPEDIKLGEVAKTDTTIPAVAFELPVGKISDPVKGAFGWVILRVLEITPGAVKTFDDVKGEIRDQFVTERSKEFLSNLTNELEDTLGAGATLEEAAKKHNVALLKVAAVDASGNDPAGQPVAGVPGRDFLTQVFASDTDLEPEFQETADGVRHAFRIDKVTPVAMKALDLVRAQVLADWRDEQITTRLTKIADDLTKKGNAGQSMASIASSLGVAALRTDPLPRYGRQELFGEETLKAAGDAKVGQFFTGPVTDGKSRIVARLAEVQYEDEAADAPLRQAYGAQLRQVFAEDLIDTFSKAVRKEVGVTIDENQFRKLRNNE